MNENNIRLETSTKEHFRAIRANLNFGKKIKFWKQKKFKELMSQNHTP